MVRFSIHASRRVSGRPFGTHLLLSKLARIPVRALDVGCGSGNLTSHLLELGFHVTSADLSPAFLCLVENVLGRRAGCECLPSTGKGWPGPDASFDFVATYFVLHHVPDYLGLVSEMVRATKPGGIVCVDHEASEGSWNPSPEYLKFKRQAEQAMPFDWSKLVDPMRYVSRFRKLFNPRYQAEGNIHVFPDDYIAWPRVRQTLQESGCEVVWEQDYLLFQRGYPEDLFEAYREQCADTHVLVAGKRAGAA